MRKVGIITVFDVENYGNRLQAYALSQKLKDLNCEVAETHYCENLISVWKGHIKKNRLLRTGYCFITSALKREKNIIKKCKRLELFFNFLERNQIKLIRSDDSSIEYYVCGSDQIWSPVFTGTPYYFAGFAAKEKRVSYAASFGLSSLPKEVAAKYKSYLDDMAHISVREQAGAKIVKDITGREAQVVLDPTLLLGRNDWQALAKKPRFPIEGNYILTYFLSWYSDEVREYIKKTAKENNMQIINLHNFDKNDYWYQTGPAEFIWLIENASLICTDSFHATVFSVIMESPFIVFKRELKGNDMHSRIESLLDMFRLHDRAFANLKEGEEFYVDYRHIPEILETERAKALDFLTAALNLGEV